MTSAPAHQQDKQTQPEPAAAAAPPQASSGTAGGAQAPGGAGWGKRVVGVVAAIAVVGLAALAGGAIWGSVVRSGDNAAMSALKTRDNSLISTLRSRDSQLNGKVVTLEGQLAGAHQAAQTATARAQAQAAAQYAARNAALKSAQGRVASQEKTLKSELGQVQASAISLDGVYVVGSDIKSGIWHTSGGGQCYYATLNSTNTFDIADNNNFTGPETVDVSGVYAFQISGGCTWYRVG